MIDGRSAVVRLENLAKGHRSPSGHVGLVSVASGGGGVAPLLEATGETLGESSLFLE